MKITHSYHGLGDAYFKARRGSLGFATFIVAHAGIDGGSDNAPFSIVELGVGSGQQTELVEKELQANGINRYKILAFDKSHRRHSGEAPGQLDILRERIKTGELSDRILPVALDFDGTSLPIDTESTDFSFMAHVQHHLTNKEKVYAELSRITRKGGRHFMLGVALEDLKDHPLDEFFPTKYTYEMERYPSETGLKEIFEAAGFTYEEPFRTGEQNVRAIDRQFLSEIENTTIDSVLKILETEDASAFKAGVARVLKEVERAEKSGDYRTYVSAERLRVFWGIKK